MERVRKNFPNKNKSAEEVFTEIGGKVKLIYDIGVLKNACATQISKALNFSLSGHEIPYFKTKDSDGNDVVQVSSGGKKLWYIYRVKALIQYLTKTYVESRPIDITKYEQELQGQKVL